MSSALRSMLLGYTALAVIASASGCGITAPSHNAGYADFDAPRYRGMDRDTNLSLGPTVLGFAAEHGNNDRATKALLQSIDGVRVSVYTLHESMDRSELLRDMALAADELVRDEWQAIVRVRDSEETVYFLLKEDQSSIVGITVLTADREELVFINVMGDISPQTLAEISRRVPRGDKLILAKTSMH